MVDRNQATRDRDQAQRELSQQLQKFARDLATGRTGLVDRFGIKITPGCYVMYRPDIDLIFEVVDVVPILDHSRPPGHLRAKLIATSDVEFVAGTRAMTMVKCGEKSIESTGETVAAIQPPGSVPPLDESLPAGPTDGSGQAAPAEGDAAAALFDEIPPPVKDEPPS